MAPDPTAQIHPSALCETDDIGARTRVWAFAHLLPGARVGSDCNICDHVFIEGGAWLGDRVTVKNASLIWDGVTIEDDVFVGPRVTFTNDLRPRVGFPVPAGQFVPTFVRRGATLGANVTVVCGTTSRPLRHGGSRRRGDPGRAGPHGGHRGAGPAGRMGLRLRPLGRTGTPLRMRSSVQARGRTAGWWRSRQPTHPDRGLKHG